jgi:hypothetical protein
MNKKAVSMYNARQIAKSNEEIAWAIREQTKSKDRVDISLEEYEHMKKEIEELKNENHSYENYFKRLNFPYDAKIIPSTIETRTVKNTDRLTTTYLIKMECE